VGSAETLVQKMDTTWVSVVGARPQFVKLAPLCRAIEAHNAEGRLPVIQHRIIHTGQHYDREIAEVLFDQLALPKPEHNLGVGSSSHGVQIARMLQRMEPLLREQTTDWVIVYGDTNSTLAGALLAARLNIPLAHVEAGCRSEDLSQPEEQNRVVADHLSQILFAPSVSAVKNLQREGIGTGDDLRRRRTVFVGDVMYDALLQHQAIAARNAEQVLRRFDLAEKRYYLLTLHRAENTNDRRRLVSLLRTASSLDLPVLFPVHPRTRHILAAGGVSLNGRIRQVPPLGFLEMITIERNAKKILTDSGGVQKEAFYLRVPCITLRERTEWPETVHSGANSVCGVEPAAIRQAVQTEQTPDWDSHLPYGDGKSAAAVVRELILWNRVSDRAIS